MAMPFPTLVEPDEWRQVQELGFQDKLGEVVSYWREYVEPGGHIDIPDHVLSDFHKAVRVHVAITADRDAERGLIALPAATYSYGVCANEACWQIAMLDQAGHHDRARRYLETFLAMQGASWLDGDFGSNEGVMQGLDFDAGVPMRSGFAYNLDHGFILECMANHYRLTGDQAWLRQASPNLVSACDFIIRERKRSQIRDPDGQPSAAWGLLPAGHLEDNPEWRHWFAVNAHAYGGMCAVAQALLEIEHPEAVRLSQEAEAYRHDIRNAAQRAMVESPVVRLLDGTYIPRISTRTHIRGREWGRFREAAYGALHLLEGHVFDAHEEEMTWVLKDLEDNLFVSRDWGRPVDVERHWFSQGRVTIQPNLMDLGIDYLRRGQTKHALRALFNNFGVSLYADVRTFTEHPVVELGHGVGPFYKSSDEAKALTWLRAFLIWEQEGDLHLALGAPCAWFEPGQSFGVHNMATQFGPITYRIESSPLQAMIHVDVPDRSPIQDLWMHIRHSENRRIESTLVNGSGLAELNRDARLIRIAAPKGILNIAVNYAR
jgi:hypothetical protein